MRVPVVIAALAALISLAGASSAPAHSPHGTGTFFQLRPDQRLCPSPACGGWFASRVNRATTACPGGAPAHACYVAELELGLLRLTSSERATFERALRAGRVLVRGRIMPAPGRERVRELLVLEGWVAQGAGNLRSPVRRIEDNGIRCVTEPCFSLHASVLNAVGVHEDVSGIDLDGTGAPRAVIEQALSSLSTTSILVAGPTVTADGGGRTIVADRLWLRTTRPPER